MSNKALREKQKQDNAEEQSSEKLGPGEQLAAARKSRGMSQEEVAERLHLRLTTVKSLENDELEKDVSLTFTKGYVKLYAKLVELNVEAIAEAFNQLHTKQVSASKLQSFSRRTEREAKDSRWNIVTYVVIIVIIASLGLWWYQNQSNDAFNFLSNKGSQSSLNNASPTSIEDNQSDEISDTELRDAGQLQVEVSVADTLSDASELPEQNDTSELAQQTQEAAEQIQEESSTEETEFVPLDIEASIQEEQEALLEAEFASDASPDDDNEPQLSIIRNSVNPPAEPVNITFRFSEDCWLQVNDATNETIAIGVKQAGYLMEIQGIPPFAINLCPPSRVEIEYEGEAIDLSRYNPLNSVEIQLPLNGS